jgi:glycerate kinase
MRVVMAPDGFGGTLSPAQAAAALAEGWRRLAPADEVELVPLSDGGPGFVDVLATALPDAERRPVTVEDALARPVEAEFLLDGTTAYVESAQACGLHLLQSQERDPKRATTYGVGQLLRAALDAGATRIVVGLGGSATNDGGAGMLAALGLQRLDAEGERLPPGPAALRRLERLSGTLDPRLAEVELVAASDVESPLLGLYGASSVFGPQKGASREDVALLDGALTRWADVLEASLDVVVRDRPGAGAAGGLGAALFVAGASMQPGIALVQDAVGLDDRVSRADLVVTGEGSFDSQSLVGKVVSGVARTAGQHAVPCVVLAGDVQLGRREAAAAGVEQAWSLVELVGRERAMSDAAAALAELAAHVAAQWSAGRPG